MTDQASSKRRAPRLLLALGLGLVAAVGLGEVLLRVFTPQAIVGLRIRAVENSVLHPRGGVFELHDELGYRPVLPGEKYERFGALRNAYPDRPPAGTRRVLFVGDSVTHRARLTGAIERAWDGPPVEWWNAGVEGYNAEQVAAYYRLVARAADADEVVWLFHLNDFASTPVLFADGDALVTFNKAGAQDVNPWLLTYSYLYRWSIAYRLRDSGSEDEWALQSAMVRAAVKALRDDVAADGARLTVLLLPVFVPRAKWKARFRVRHASMLELLERLEIPHHDLALALDEALAEGRTVNEAPYDFQHPSDAFAEVAARQLLREGFLAP